MKATLFTFNKKSEIVFENGDVIANKKGETAEDLQARAEDIAKDKYLEDLEVSTVELKQLKKRGTTQLVKRLGAKDIEDLEKAMIESILKERDVKSTTRPVEEKPAPKAAPKVAKEDEIPVDPKAEKAAKKDAKNEGKASHKNDINPMPKQKGADKPARESKAKTVTAEDIEACQAEAEKAKKNIGSKVSFLAFRGEKKVRGTIKAVWVDKRRPVALYKIIMSDGTAKNKVINSEDLTIIKK